MAEDRIDFLNPQSIAQHYREAAKPERLEILKKLTRKIPGKVRLSIKIRRIAGELKKIASYDILKEYEMNIAMLLHPKRKTHLLASYLCGKNYQDRVKPYIEKIDRLKRRKTLKSETLLPITADMAESEGYALAKDYFDQVRSNNGTDTELRRAIGPLDKIESALFNIKNTLPEKPKNNSEYRKMWELIRPAFDEIYKKGIGPLFIERVKKSDALQLYGPALEKYLDFRDRKKAENGTTTATGSGKSSSIKSQTREKKLLIKMILDVLKKMPSIEVVDIWLEYINREPLIEEEEKRELKRLIDEGKYATDDGQGSQDGGNGGKSQIERYMRRLTINLDKKEEITAKIQLIDQYRNFKTNSVIEKIREIYGILLLRVDDAQAVESTFDQDLGSTVQEESSGNTDEILDNILASVDEILLENRDELERSLAHVIEENKNISKQISEITKIEDPEDRFEEAMKAYGSELYCEYQEVLLNAIDTPFGFGRFIRNLEQGPLRDMTPWEMKDFFDKLITAAKKVPAIMNDRPDLIRKLMNYRDNRIAETSLLQIVFINLKKIKEKCPFNMKKGLQQQVHYLSECLKNVKFKPVRLSVYRIYQNILQQVLDENLLKDIGNQAPWKQVMILKSLEQCFAHKPEEIDKIHRLLSEDQLAETHRKMSKGAQKAITPSSEEVMERMVATTLADMDDFLSDGLSFDEIEPFSDLLQAETALNEEKQLNKKEELSEIRLAVENVLADTGEDAGKYHDLGKTVGASNFLDPQEITHALGEEVQSLEGEGENSKFSDILKASKRMNTEIEPLPSLQAKIIRLQFWIDNDYESKSHVQEFLAGQITEYTKKKAREGGLLERLFRDIGKIADTDAKIEYLEKKLSDPEYRHLKITIQNLIVEIQEHTAFAPGQASLQRIDQELRERNGDPEEQLDWIKRKKSQDVFTPLSDHLNTQTASVEEAVEESVLKKCVQDKLKSLDASEQPKILGTIEELVEAVLQVSGSGKRQQVIIEQESLNPTADDSLFGQQRRMLFYLMSASGDDPNSRVRALADRRKLSFVEKQRYLLLIGNALQDETCEGGENFADMLGITSDHITYHAVYILKINDPLKSRINYLKNFRDNRANEKCVSYKDKFGLSANDFHRVIKDLENRLSNDKTPAAAKNDTPSGINLPDSKEVETLFPEPGKSPQQIAESIISKQTSNAASISHFQERIEHRLRKRGESICHDKKEVITTRIDEMIKTLQATAKPEQERDLVENLIKELKTHDAAAIPAIIEETVLPELRKRGREQSAETIEKMNEELFKPALEGDNSRISNAVSSEMDAPVADEVGTILGNIRNAWQEEVKEQIETENRLETESRNAIDEAAQGGEIAAVLRYLYSLEPDRIAIELRRTFIGNKKLKSVESKLEILEGLFRNTIGVDGLDKHFGNDSGMVRKILEKIREERKKIEKMLSSRTKIKAEGPPIEDTQTEKSSIEEIQLDEEAQTEIPAEIRKILMDLEDFKNPHLLISKVTKDENFKGGNRENRESLLRHLSEEGKIFSYDRNTYIGHGKIYNFLTEQKGLANYPERQKALFTRELLSFLKGLKSDEQRYDFLGVPENNIAKRENDYKRFIRIISKNVPQDAKTGSLKPSAQSSSASPAREAPVSTTPARNVSRGIPAKGKRSGSPVQRKKAAPISRRKPTPAATVSSREPRQKARSFSPELQEIRLKILTDASKSITKSLKKLITLSKKGDPSLFNQLPALYLGMTAKKANLINLLDLHKDRVLIERIQSDEYLLSHLTFDRKSISRLYNKLK